MEHINDLIGEDRKTNLKINVNIFFLSHNNRVQCLESGTQEVKVVECKSYSSKQENNLNYGSDSYLTATRIFLVAPFNSV
jgi:hypothetical protein